MAMLYIAFIVKVYPFYYDCFDGRRFCYRSFSWR